MKILLIDTSEAKCSVAIAENGAVIGEISSGEEAQIANARSDHSEKLSLYIQEIIRKYGEYDAVAVNVGPGSYTGLRIGLSTAKGLCYGGNKPLVAINSLEALVQGVVEMNINMGSNAILVPMIDARRMEVYSASYNVNGVQLSDIQPIIIGGETFKNSTSKHYIFGSGAAKCQDQLRENGVDFTLVDIKQSAASMAKIAHHKLSEAMVEDVAYIEPFYLKEWQPAQPKKKNG